MAKRKADEPFTLMLNADTLRIDITNDLDGEGRVRLMITAHLNDAAAKYWDVKRTHILGWSCGHGSNAHTLADRLVRALRAGFVFDKASIQQDVNGDNYVSAASNVWGRHMNADLKRLGY